MKKIGLFLLYLFLIPRSAYPVIIEIKSIHEIAHHIKIDKNTLIAYDLDNTLMHPQGNLGSDQWFYFLYKLYKTKGIKPEEIESKAMAIWNRAQKHVRIIPVEADVSAIIRTQQSQGIATLGLTARTREIADITLEQLYSLGIQFEGSVILDEEASFPRKDLGSREDAFFKKGILFIGEGNNKGTVLIHFLRRFSRHFEKIVLIDDKMRNVQKAEVALAKAGIPFIGFRYGALDEKVSFYPSELP